MGDQIQAQEKGDRRPQNEFISFSVYFWLLYIKTHRQLKEWKQQEKQYLNRVVKEKRLKFIERVPFCVRI